jgi:hypothetical protein
VTLKRIAFEIMIGIVFSSYIFIITLFSPCPPFVNSKFGGFIIVSMWILMSFVFIRCRCIIAAKIEQHGPNVLFRLGWSTIMGQVIGGIISYIYIDVFRLLVERPHCGFVCPS